MKATIFAAVLLIAGAAFSAPASEKWPIYISVTNGGPHGTWGTIGACPEGSKAAGFSLKVQDHLAVGDNTAVNGIKLYCYDAVLKNESTVESITGQLGDWIPRTYCSESDYLSAFSLRVLEEQGGNGDDTSVNDIQFQCLSREILDGKGLNSGTWGNWSAECTEGICGLQTKVQSDQGVIGDDSALNDVEFFCC